MASGSSTRDARQAKAAEMRAKVAKAEARRRTMLVGGVVAVLVAVIVGVFVVVQNTRRDESTANAATPANIGAANSIVVGQDSAPVTVTVYEDFQCPYCAQFEATNREQLATWVKDGDVKVQYRPIAFLDRASTDKYSTRALNATAAVMNSAPEAFDKFHSLLFENQPAEGGAGLTDDQLVAFAVEAGAPEAEIRAAVDDLTYEGWTAQVTEDANKDKVNSTPTVMVDGTTLENPATLTTDVEKALAEAK